jgi:hypothetical protein
LERNYVEDTEYANEYRIKWNRLNKSLLLRARLLFNIWCDMRWYDDYFKWRDSNFSSIWIWKRVKWLCLSVLFYSVSFPVHFLQKNWIINKVKSDIIIIIIISISETKRCCNFRLLFLKDIFYLKNQKCSTWR